MPLGADASAIVIAEKVRCGALGAQLIVENVLADIQLRNDSFNCFTRVLAETARKAAQVIDQKVMDGVDPGPLAGVPFGAKDLFDIAGIPTTAGAKLRLNAPPAKSDAEVVARLKRAGAILIGTLNMDEFAYGFATVNAHFGPTRNPHDPSRLAGGSSGGSAAAVAAGLVPIALGSEIGRAHV
jgi:aspartyl-tRNA(Asn)/glutamyl-tRNA(Gln) amidotransferase subunit A